MIGQLKRSERRAVHFRRRRSDPLAGPWAPLPGSIRPPPFAALARIMPAVKEALAAPAGVVRQMALAALPPLRHRGHGGVHRAWQRTVMGRAMLNRSR